MGTQDVQANLSDEQRRAFMSALLRDARALEHLIEHGLIESGKRRIGAEQELVLVDRDWRPAPVAMEVLAEVTDPRVTTELARFNIECNLSPLDFHGDCLTRMRDELRALIGIVREACRRHGADVVLAGILPTLGPDDLARSNMSDRARYFALDAAFGALRGAPYEIAIKGIDELEIEHDSLMLEALNTSFQLHYQVSAEEFAPLYNLAQAVAGPLLAACVNSPVLFGKRLWRETRIAIFQQTVDTRIAAPAGRDLPARVRFGEGWVQRSPMELFQADITRYRVILGREVTEDPFEAIEAGRAPRLQALQLHNSTVYRWNRACYGVSGNGAGTPHLRIENRVLPAGPTVEDEIANAAFWFGLMRAGTERFGDVKERLDFDEAQSNFISAARQGLQAELTWLDHQPMPARELILNELLPVAREGLRLASVDDADADRALAVVAERVESRQTGAQWLLRSVAEMKGRGTRSERLAALTAGIFTRQNPPALEPQAPVEPVHRWTLARLEEAGEWTRNFQRVDQYMTTDLFTVREDETIDLVATLMDWEHVRHVPVEDDKHRLVGIVTSRVLLRHLTRRLGERERSAASVAVRDIMKRDLVTVSPETSTLDAIALMRERRCSCLPVVRNDKLVGIVTEHDFMPIAGRLLEEQLRVFSTAASAPADQASDGSCNER